MVSKVAVSGHWHRPVPPTKRGHKISGVVRVWAGGNDSFSLTRDGRFWASGAAQKGIELLDAQSKGPVVWPLSLLQPT